MKVLVLALLALVVTPLVFAIFQTKSYQSTLKPEVLSKVSGILTEQGLGDLDLKLDHLDVSVTGSVDAEQVEQIKAAQEAIAKIGSGEVRASAKGFDVEVNGDLKVSKTGNALVFSGHVNDLDPVKTQLSEGLPDLTSEDAPDLKKDQLFTDSPTLSSAPLKEWSNQFLALRGDRSFSISAKDDIVRPVGEMTPSLQARFTKMAQDSGLKIDPSGFEIVAATPAEFNLSQANGALSLKAKTPVDFDSSTIFPTQEVEAVSDPFVEVHPSLEKPEFATWVKSYMGAKGERGLMVVDNAVTMTGMGTPSLQNRWEKDLKALALQPTSKLTLYPSEYHYPGYQRESQLTPEQANPLFDAFALNQIFFDSGSSEVREDQQEKITALQEAIQAAGEDINFIIGGHADATGNVQMNQELSKKRAQAVVDALAAKGIVADRFTIASFGAAEASSSGSNEGDRKVEILIK